VTDAEAAIVAAIVAECDGGCAVCAARATCRLARDMPWIDWWTLVADAMELTGRDRRHFFARDPCKDSA
jgi:hypothetical protein